MEGWVFPALIQQVPRLTIGRLDRVEADDFLAIQAISDLPSAQSLRRYYSAQLYPLTVKQYWVDRWESTVAGQGVDQLALHSISTLWLRRNIIKGHE